MKVPVPLGELLGRVPHVQRGWQRLPVAERHRYIEWVQSATSPERQEVRADTAARLIARGDTLPPRVRRFRLRARAKRPGYDLTDDGTYLADGFIDL